LGGTALTLSDDFTLTYASVAGRFIEPWATGINERGYMQSVVANYAMSDKTNYIFQTDYLDTEDEFGNEGRNTYGIAQYLIHSINDCVGVGVRGEWWAASQFDSPRQNIYDLTMGVNYRPHANLVFRPEIRWDWVDDATFLLDNAGDDNNQTTFGVDAILTF
jgi:hypothetical protein